MSQLVKNMARYAADAHRGQKRKYSGAPYVVHCGRVANLVMLQETTNDEDVAAGWGHDLIEDTTVTYADIRNRFGAVIADLIRELTNEPKDPLKPMNRAERKKQQCEKMRGASERARVIKCCDRLDNLWDLPDNDFRKQYAVESGALFQAMMDPTLISHPAAVELWVKIRELSNPPVPHVA